MKIAFIGYGDFGKQIHAFFQQANLVSEAVFFDDIFFLGKEKNAYAFNQYEKEIFKDYSFVIGLGYKHLKKRQMIISQLLSSGKSVLSFYHSTCFINSITDIGKGVVVYPMSNIDKEVKIGDGTIINNSVTISHNTEVGECCYISPGVVISGNVKIGDATFIGSGVAIANNISIGSNVTIGIGTIVTQNISDNSCVIGNPMKYVKKLELI